MQSMTGFARIDGADETAQWVIEAKSVNAKGLDVRIRAPQGYDAVDTALRAAAKQALSRGTVQVSINLTPIKQADGQTKVNHEVLSAYIELYDDYKAVAAPPRFDGLLRLPGVLQSVDESEPADLLDQRLTQMQTDVRQLITALKTARLSEGAALKSLLQQQLADIGALVAQARAFVGTTQSILEARLEKGLIALGQRGEEFDAARLHQEIALLIVKADVTEELDRLDGHIKAAQSLLDGDGPVGRKFDFLMQEFNREANTLCSKAVDQELTTIGLNLKTVIDQMKEQIQNVE